MTHIQRKGSIFFPFFFFFVLYLLNYPSTYRIKIHRIEKKNKKYISTLIDYVQLLILGWSKSSVN